MRMLSATGDGASGMSVIDIILECKSPCFAILTSIDMFPCINTYNDIELHMFQWLVYIGNNFVYIFILAGFC